MRFPQLPATRDAVLGAHPTLEEFEEASHCPLPCLFVSFSVGGMVTLLDATAAAQIFQPSL